MKITFSILPLLSGIVLAVLLCTGRANAQDSQWITLDSFLIAPYSFSPKYPIQWKDIRCADSANLMVVGKMPDLMTVVRRSTDAGLTWKTVLIDTTIIVNNIPDMARRFASVTCQNPKLCFVTGQSGDIYRTTDMGDTWQRIPVPAARYIGEISMCDNKTGIARVDSHDTLVTQKGSDSLLLTNDGGLTWRTVLLPPEETNNHQIVLQSVYCLNSTTFLLGVTRGGMLDNNIESRVFFATNDGGQSWRKTVIPDSAEPGDAYYGEPGVYVSNFMGHSWFFDADNGMMMGSRRVGPGDKLKDIILRTTDGGRTWIKDGQRFTCYSQVIGNLSFADRWNGMASGAGGKVLRTTDGGATWMPECGSPNTVGNSFFTATMVSPTLAYAAVGGNGTIKKWLGPLSSVVHEKAPQQQAASLVIAPNITGGSMRIGVRTARDADVVLMLLNPQGQSVLPLYNGILAAGDHWLPVPAQALAAGQYFVRLTCAGESILAPLVIVR